MRSRRFLGTAKWGTGENNDDYDVEDDDGENDNVEDDAVEDVDVENDVVDEGNHGYVYNGSLSDAVKNANFDTW